MAERLAYGDALTEAAAALAEDPAGAERMARSLLAAAPQDPRAGLILASAQRRRGDAAAALARLEPLARAHPRAASTHYELGLARAALGDNPGAIAALRHAVAVNRDLPLAWRALGDLLFRDGDARGAQSAFAEHLRASVQAPDAKAAADALAAEDPVRAEALLRAHLARSPRDVLALQMLGDALGRQARHAEAEAVLEHALALDPGFDGARFALAHVLFQQQKALDALSHVRRLLAQDPKDAPARNLLAACLALVGDIGEVEAIHRELLAEFPRQPKLWLNYGHALRTVDRAEEAACAYRQALALDPALGDGYWSLANLKTARFADADVTAMRAQLSRRDLPSPDRLHTAYALGKALEDRRDWGASFAAYAEGAAIRRAEIDYDPHRTTAELSATRACLTPDFLHARADVGLPAADPIFVVGLPRSGSTLIEQILASHSDVEGTMELPDVGLIARDLARPAQTPSHGLLRVAKGDFAALARRYLDGAQAHRRQGRPRFIDKMPNNFRHIGLIHCMLPNARIIDVRRHPLGAGFGVFKQHFAQGQLFSYSLQDIGLYYRDYVDLMTHVDEVLPGRVIRVVYEDLVDDFEAEVRRLLDRLDLIFDPTCLRFWETSRQIKTVSSEQVRQPIFRSGVERWRDYEPWLGPLKFALGPALEAWRR